MQHDELRTETLPNGTKNVENYAGRGLRRATEAAGPTRGGTPPNRAACDRDGSIPIDGRVHSPLEFPKRLEAQRSGRMRCERPTCGSLPCAALSGGASSAHAQDTIKIGLINVYSGQFADAGIQLDNGVKTYMKQHGDTVAGKKIEIIRKDVGGVAPDVAKRLAQELIVRDKVDILAGFLLTPNALAAADVSAEAKKFMVVMNAATSIITTKSPYMVRTSVTLPQVAETFGTWAAKKAGIKKSYTMVTDYGPGHDFEGGFQRAFKEAGGEIVGSVRFPVANPGFLRLRAARQGPQSGIDHDLHSGRRAAGGARQGVRRARRRSEQDQDPGLRRDHRRAGAARAWATPALGIITAWHYDYTSKDPKNVAFVKAVQRDARPQPGLLLDRRL